MKPLNPYSYCYKSISGSEIHAEDYKVSNSLISVTAQFHAKPRLPVSCRDSCCHDNHSGCDGQSDENPQSTSGPIMSTLCSQ